MNAAINRPLHSMLLRPVSQVYYCRLKAKGCTDPVKVWRDGEKLIVVDGHNRVEICSHPDNDIPFDVVGQTARRSLEIRPRSRTAGATMIDDCPKTLLEAARYFADLDVCEEYMRRIRWPDGKITCPACGGTKIGEVKTRRILRCKGCRKQIRSKVGTIFEDSPLGLDKWFVAVWAIANCKNGISSHELARAIGVTQKSAWFMLHRIRAAMEAGGLDKFDGPAEADTSYVGGASKNMHAKRRERLVRGRGASGSSKTAIHGILQRADGEQISQVRAEVVGNDDASRLVPAVRRNVRFGATVYTDAARAYADLADTQLHRHVDHSIAYAVGEVHTNGLENFWSLLKRSLGGTYVAVAPFHLCRYVAEQVMRFNERSKTDAGRFLHVLAGVLGKRLTYRVLTAQGDAGFMGIR